MLLLYADFCGSQDVVKVTDICKLFFIMVLFFDGIYGLIEVYIRLSETVKNFISGGNSMGKLLLTGVDGNLGAEAAKVLLELEDKDNLIFCGYDPRLAETIRRYGR